MKQFLACVAVALLTIGCGDSGGGGLPTDPSQVVIAFTTTDVVVGTGAQAAAGNAVTVHYTGWLYNPAGGDSKGTQFDTSLDGDPPLTVSPLGSAQIISGFQQAIVGMRVGGKRRVYMPGSLAYGAAGRAPQIPPNAALVFEIELVTVQ